MEVEQYESKLSTDRTGISDPKKWYRTDRIIDQAKFVFRNASEKGLVRGRTHTTVVAAAVYIACRETEAPCPLHDIANVVNVKRKVLGRCCRILMNKLYLDLPTIDPSKCIEKKLRSLI
jgi:transcription initiation factor TFIIB